MSSKILLDDVKSFPPVKITVAELTKVIDSFIHSLEGKQKETVGTYERSLRYFLKYCSTDSKFLFRVKDIERYRDHLKNVRGLESASISTYLTAVRRLCDYLVAIGILPKNPAKKVQGERRPQRHNRSHLTLEEIKILLSLFGNNNSTNSNSKSSLQSENPFIEHDFRSNPIEKKYRDKALLLMMFGSMTSELEIINMNIGDIEKKNGKYFVSVLGKGRTIKDEVVQTSELSIQALIDYLRFRLTSENKHDFEYVLSLSEADLFSQFHPEQPLFLSQSNSSKGERMSIRGVRQAVNYRLVEAGLKQGRERKLTAFSLRHTSGILLAAFGLSPEIIMQRMRIEWRPTAMLYIKQSSVYERTEMEFARVLVF